MRGIAPVDADQRQRLRPQRYIVGLDLADWGLGPTADIVVLIEHLDAPKIALLLYNILVQMLIPDMTIETTYSQAREQLKTLMDRAVDDREVILVRRRSGEAVAMIAADELKGLLETAHLLRSAKNAERLLTALSRARHSKLKPSTLAKIKKEAGLAD